MHEQRWAEQSDSGNSRTEAGSFTLGALGALTAVLLVAWKLNLWQLIFAWLALLC